MTAWKVATLEMRFVVLSLFKISCRKSVLDSLLTNLLQKLPDFPSQGPEVAAILNDGVEEGDAEEELCHLQSIQDQLKNRFRSSSQLNKSLI
jgi:hypothetical protein